MTGCLLIEETDLSGNTIKFERATLPSGVYLMEVSFEDGAIGRQKIVIQ